MGNGLKKVLVLSKDGTKNEWTSTVTITDDGKTHTWTGTGTLGGEKVADQHDVWRRVSKKAMAPAGDVIGACGSPQN